MLAHTAGIETAATGTRLSKVSDAREAAKSIREMLEARSEWLYVRDGRKAISARRDELDFRVAHNALLFYCLSDEGREAWRICAWARAGEKLLFEARRRAGRERALLELIPRIPARVLAEEVSATRRARCAQLAQLACARLPGAVIERTSLSAGAGFNQPGPFARILIKHGQSRIALTGIVADAEARRADSLLSSTLLWFLRLRENARAPLNLKLWIAVEKPCVETLRQRAALLRPDLTSAISLYELDRDSGSLTTVPVYEMEELFEARAPRISRYRTETSETAASITALAPEAIDVVRARHGETLRFHGLPFARVRRALGHERVWFGLDASRRRMLDDDTRQDWEKLLRELVEHRHAGSDARQHALFSRAPEAWLESILRRDITRLDPGLRLAPVHAQFRAAQTKSATSRPVDLLALRRDGRLVVIELKVSEDREHVLQGADYWRRVEAYRRQGAITRARLFEDAEIADEPPLVYLAAPALSFHRSLNKLAQTLRPEIELYRFDLNHDWRTELRVTRRETLTNSLQ
ncbi:MAG TPA: hypothetical protein VJS44_01610 [Pyrinomonadaceae bacterium]|nr:hypothetical protein [Pyrinomonadaceae bacterium]